MLTLLDRFRFLIWMWVAVKHFREQDIDAPYQGLRLVFILRGVVFGFFLPAFFWAIGAIPDWGALILSFAIYMAMGESYWHTKEWWGSEKQTQTMENGDKL